MHDQLRQDVVVDLRDLTPEERKRFIDLHLAILATRYTEAIADYESAKNRAAASNEFAKQANHACQGEESRQQNERERAARDQKERDLREQRDKEWSRPSHMHCVEVTYDEGQKQFAATYYGITAYGNSPEMACDNFDHLWLYGN